MPGAATDISSRLRELGIELPEPAAPLAAYVGFVQAGNLLYVSGQVPVRDGAVIATGRLGDTVSLEDGQACARLCAVNILAQLRIACEGDWSRVERCVRLGGFVAATPEFEQHPQVINGASELIGEVMGERGAHARAAVGVASLPRGVPVEVDAIFAMR